MADFCAQCSISTWGRDMRDLAGLTSAADYAKGLAATVICEGCGPVQVDPDGRCVSADCQKRHGDQAAKG